MKKTLKIPFEIKDGTSYYENDKCFAVIFNALQKGATGETRAGAKFNNCYRSPGTSSWRYLLKTRFGYKKFEWQRCFVMQSFTVTSNWTNHHCNWISSTWSINLVTIKSLLNASAVSSSTTASRWVGQILRLLNQCRITSKLMALTFILKWQKAKNG